ncbi:MAG: 2-amino-4-hydroxy-6-hydroxymethyldihydropteridine diphosphokinase [Chloroflexota bacterium]|jgi:2-amino-4-hydroxy-6-hydroxymethyldihydropteridine diphosphokinase|nr:2-amino-4-hydroxy-6-hydroxymethyldihydropteridine diphosphokinase [Chloroflexota bacterium]
MAKRVRARRVRAYVGLGANLGDTRANLRHAVHALTALPGVRVRGVSRLYKTKPIGVTDQPDFLNAVAALEVPAGPDPETGALALLSVLKVLEAATGRKARRRWGPREIDLDLLVFGRHRIRVERPNSRAGKRWLEVPHPEARGRLFVLAPLADLAPWLIPPGWGESVEVARRRAAAAAPDNAVQIVGKL